jgi:hypothetical protein
MQFTTKNARGRVEGRGVHRVGLPLVLGLKTSVPPTFLLHLREEHHSRFYQIQEGTNNPN